MNFEESMKTIHLTYRREDDNEAELVAGRHMSRLSGDWTVHYAVSLPETPDRLQLRLQVGRDKECASWSRGRNGVWRKKKKKKKGWETRRSDRAGESEQCRLLVRPMGPCSGCVCMDMTEVKACRDLGLELPCDWTVEVPGGVSGVDTGSGSSSSIANWRISSPGDDPKEVKARLKVWAQAVALASAADSN